MAHWQVVPVNAATHACKGALSRWHSHAASRLPCDRALATVGALLSCDRRWQVVSEQCQQQVVLVTLFPPTPPPTPPS